MLAVTLVRISSDELASSSSSIKMLKPPMWNPITLRSNQYLKISLGYDEHFSIIVCQTVIRKKCSYDKNYLFDVMF